MMRWLLVAGVIAGCGDDGTETPQLGGEDPASTVPCHGTFRFPNPPLPVDSTVNPYTGGAIAIADINGDARSDIVSVTRGGVFTHLREADGNYAPAVSYNKADRISGVKVVDLFGNDGMPEVAVTPLTIFRNKGDGTFLQTSYSGNGLSDFGDADGGGQPDMIVLDDSGNLSSWNNAGTSFTAPSGMSSTGITSALAFTVADVNGDSKVDAIVMTEPAVYLLLNNGTGGFCAPTTIDMSTDCGHRGTQIEVHDVTSDGLADIVFSTSPFGGALRMSVLPKLASGTFGPRLDSAIVILNYDPLWSIGDVDGDAIEDAAIADGSGNVGIALGNGQGMFVLSAEISSAASSVAIGDLDSDGRGDLVTGALSGPVSILMSGADSELVARRAAFQTQSVDVALLPGAMGETNMVTLDTTQLSVFGHAPDGSVGGIAHTYPIPSAIKLVTMDVNSDGVPDLFAAGAGQDAQIFVTSGSELAPVSTLPVPHSIQFAAVADFDNDSDLDLVVAADADQTRMYSLWLIRGRGNGTFDAPIMFATGMDVRSLTAADLDHDGRSDLVYDAVDTTQPSSPPADTVVLHGNGDGTFSESSRIPWKRGPGDMHFRDLDGDGVRELVRAERDGIAVWNVDPAGAITERSFKAHDFVGSASVVGDVNGDGRLDLVTYGANYGINLKPVIVRLWLNEGDGSFANPVAFEAASSSVRSIALGDLNRDGQLDIAVAGQKESSIMYGRCVE